MGFQNSDPVKNHGPTALVRFTETKVMSLYREPEIRDFTFVFSVYFIPEKCSPKTSLESIFRNQAGRGITLTHHSPETGMGRGMTAKPL